jgi:uncharacterized protein (TIGR00730 family)
MSGKRICVYCGSSPGNDSRFQDAAVDLGVAMASAGYDLVYGGSSIGLMGRLADTVLDSGGNVYGVIPRSLAEKEIAHTGLTELHIASSMHERKSTMADLSDAFVALSGGLGTLEELFEIWTWGQLGFHEKPIAVMNTSGYYDDLLSFLDQATANGFIKGPHREMLIEASEPVTLLQSIEGYLAPTANKL